MNREIFQSGFKRQDENRFKMYQEGFGQIPTMEGINNILVPIPEEDSKDYIPINKLGENK